jgi:predicted DNA-binding protein (UPF0251 family)
MRPKSKKVVSFVTNSNHFIPITHHSEISEEVILAIEEIEALRLKDLQGLEQRQAAQKMNISQPTFHRLLLGARKKVSDAIVNAKQLKIE